MSFITFKTESTPETTAPKHNQDRLVVRQYQRLLHMRHDFVVGESSCQISVTCNADGIHDVQKMSPAGVLL